MERVQKCQESCITIENCSSMLIDAYKEYVSQKDGTEKIFREISDLLKKAVDIVIDSATFMRKVQY